MWPWSGFHWLNRKENAECVWTFSVGHQAHFHMQTFFLFCFVFWFLKSWIVLVIFFFFLDIVLKICCVPMPFYWWTLKGNANLLKIQHEVGRYEKCTTFLENKTSNLYQTDILTVFRTSLRSLNTSDLLSDWINLNFWNGWRCPLKKLNFVNSTSEMYLYKNIADNHSIAHSLLCIYMQYFNFCREKSVLLC